MKRMLNLKSVWVATALVSTIVFGAFAFGGKEVERDSKQFYYLDAAKMTTQSGADTVNTVIAFDPENEDFIWKDYTDSESDWKKIEIDVLDEALRDVKMVESVKVIDEHVGTYYKMRKLTENGKTIIGLDLGLRMNGGGPGLAVLCGVVCKFIGIAGCGAGTFILAPLSPPVAFLYGAVCAALDTGGTAGCVGACLAMPTP